MSKATAPGSYQVACGELEVSATYLIARPALCLQGQRIMGSIAEDHANDVVPFTLIAAAMFTSAWSKPLYLAITTLHRGHDTEKDNNGTYSCPGDYSHL